MWQTIRLGDVCTISSSKRIFAKEYQTEGIPFYRGKEIIEKHNGNKVSTELFISPKRYEEIKGKYEVPKKGDILLTSVGTLGIPWLVDEDVFYFKDGNLTWLRCNTQILPSYLYLWLNSAEAQNQIDVKCIGSTQKALTIETLNKFQITLPSLELQKKIVAVINPIESRININRSVNENLEQQSLALFSNYYEQSNTEIGFTDLIQVLGGGTPKTRESTYWNGNIPFFTPKDVGFPYTLATEKTITEDGLLHCNSRLYPVNTVFVTARGTVGKVGIAGVPMAMNQSCYALIGKGIHQLLVYFYTLKAIDRLKHKASGAVFDAIITKDFETEQVFKLSPNDTDTFIRIVEPMYQSILNNSIEKQRLIALRDSLLPKLMSGEIDISNLDL